MTHKTSPTFALAWQHTIREISEAGLSGEREAGPDERAGIAAALDLLDCMSLRAAYKLVPTVAGRYRLSGTLRAEITQACVVTLDPVETTIEESFEVTFWPQEDMPTPRGGAVDLDDEPDPEPIVSGRIDVGRVVLECLAAAIDPFPRKAGASLDLTAQGPAESTADKGESPFAVLARIKAKA